MKKLLSIILSITMLFSMTAVAFTEEATTSGAREVDGIIKVGINAEFPPFEYMENDKILGFDVDLMNYIAARINYGVEFVNMSFDKLIPAVVNGEVDCAISAITVTEERESVIDYTTTYLIGQTEIDGEIQQEQYAIVFPDNYVQKAKLAEAAGQEFIYTLVNDALKEFIDNGTVDKLIKQCGLNKATAETGYSYFIVSVSNGDYPVTGSMAPGYYDTPIDEENADYVTSGTPLAPPSDWATADVEKAKSLNITTDNVIYRYRMSITREQFCELIYNYVSEFGELPADSGHILFIDTDNTKIRILNTLGIIKGKSETEFAPNDLLTREEAATILNRLINVVHPDLASTELYFEFADGTQISDWAMNDIQRICNMGVMKGVGNNNFAPKDNYTTEQAIVTLVRVYASSGISKNVIGGADEPTGILVGEQNKEDNDKLIYGYQVDDTGKILNLSELKKFYIEFAMDNRIDFIPDFDEKDYKTNNPVSTEEFLMLTYYMNKDNLSEDLSMSAELVEKVMRENFGIEKVEHKSQFKGWTYVEEENKYTPYPEGTAEDGIFDVINFNSYKENDKKIYDVTLREYYLPFLFSKDDSALSDIYNSYVEYTKNEENVYRENVLFLLDEKGEKIKNAEINIYNAMYELIVEDNTDGFTAGKTIRIKYYIDEITGTPRFIYKNEELSVLQ